jgi:hypothetical protein
MIVILAITLVKPLKDLNNAAKELELEHKALHRFITETKAEVILNYGSPSIITLKFDTTFLLDSRISFLYAYYEGLDLYNMLIVLRYKTGTVWTKATREMMYRILKI